ncbi:phosphoglycolate phosphatase [Ramlibacter sp. Leaf400]|uniref:phosphoglycolate phosphatase n=1 Tax=Ramlibacter sp. Leaf400 TaxID=1736365 RepID=UPI0007003597|nr:phosphoglycolate phosphatase [Ramlibacter sp. Leaf400]KQT12146.1 phosphoglycolate phosphatase [Ramlibacter sp. Leaf400]
MPLTPGFQAAIVDLDGTLVDTLGDFTVALNATLAQLSLPPLATSDVESLVGKGSEHLIRSALAAVDAPQQLYDAAWDAYQRHYGAINGQHSAVYPGAEEGLDLLRRAGLRLACVTNKPTRFATELLERKGLAGAFEVVFGGDAFERKKPDPLPFVRTCERLGAPAQRTLVVGDSSNDAAAARAASCPVVLVTYGYNHGEPVSAVDADGFVDSLAQIGRWL